MPMAGAVHSIRSGLKQWLDRIRNVALRDAGRGRHTSHQKHATVCRIHRM